MPRDHIYFMVEDRDINNFTLSGNGTQVCKTTAQRLEITTREVTTESFASDINHLAVVNLSDYIFCKLSTNSSRNVYIIIHLVSVEHNKYYLLFDPVLFSNVYYMTILSQTLVIRFENTKMVMNIYNKSSVFWTFSWNIYSKWIYDALVDWNPLISKFIVRLLHIHNFFWLSWLRKLSNWSN